MVSRRFFVTRQGEKASEWVLSGERVHHEDAQDNGNHPETLFRKGYVDSVKAAVKKLLDEKATFPPIVQRTWAKGRREAGISSVGSVPLCPYLN